MHDYIQIRGGRENNLRGIDVDIPKRRLTVFTGVSGSGKSSLVFGTIAAESQRLINETYPAFVQGFMPALSRPDYDQLNGLTTAIVVDQERMGANARSTVGTATDAGALLRILFSRLGQPHVGSPNAFSFNVPTVRAAGAMTIERGSTAKAVKTTFNRAGGMCPACEGMGIASQIDLTQIYDKTKSLAAGAITVPGYTADGWNVRIFTSTGLLDPHKPIGEYSDTEMHDFLYREPSKFKINGINLTYEGLIPRLQKSILSKDKDALQSHLQDFVERAVTFAPCPDCAGTRLNEAARSSQIAGINIAQACDMQINDLTEWLRTLDAPQVAPLLANLTELLTAFVDIGLGYLTLSRSAGSLSGGEASRTKMVRHLGSALTDVTYIFDEPSAGLHPHDVTKLNTLLGSLRDKGNTVLVVEHKPEIIAVADHIVDLGPGAGSQGGQICFTGTVAGLTASDTVTGRHLQYRAQLKPTVRSARSHLEVRGATANNLRSVDVDIPLGVLTVITGVAGSGKSSLVHKSLPASADVIYVEQSPIRGSRRSNPATYTGLLEPIRKAFAKANGVKPALFSANSEGACPACNGAGMIYTELGMLATVSTVCEECEGRRFQADVLNYRLGGRNIAQVLEMSAGEAAEFFAGKSGSDGGPLPVPAARKILTHLNQVGLGYLRLGQPLSTLSGGERQRLKLATHLGNKGGIYVLDEPTTGLHLADVAQLLTLLDHLVDAGKSVIVVEHHQAVMAHADWLIDMGPGAGHDGGEVVFQGPPAALVASGATLTGQHLAAYVGKG